jgi:hypothetical protein
LLDGKQVVQFTVGWLNSMVLISNYTCFGKQSSDPLICSGNGICQKNGICSCQSNFTGLQCEFTSCYGKNSSQSNVCSGNGNCTDTNVCSCTSGYEGDQCELFLDNIDNNVLYTFGQNHVRNSSN